MYYEDESERLARIWRDSRAWDEETRQWLDAEPEDPGPQPGSWPYDYESSANKAWAARIRDYIRLMDAWQLRQPRMRNLMYCSQVGLEVLADVSGSEDPKWIKACPREASFSERCKAAFDGRPIPYNPCL